MDGKGRYLDNLFIEHLWRTVMYEEVCLKAYANGREAKVGLGACFGFYKTELPHQPLGCRIPAEVFNRQTGNAYQEQAERGSHNRYTW